MPNSAALQSARTSRVWLVGVSMVSVQTGAAIAEKVMVDVGPAGAVLLRQTFAAAILLAIRRPSLRGRTKASWQRAFAFAIVLAVMNLTFYASVQRLPLGIAVTVELLGPLGLAAVLSRRPIELACAATATLGVIALGIGDRTLDAVGLLLAAIAAVGWALYITIGRVLGKSQDLTTSETQASSETQATSETQASSDGSALDGVALALLIGSVLVAPFGVMSGGSALLRPRVLLLGACVAVLGAVIPFSMDVLTLRHVSPRVFGILMGLSPVVAAGAGAVILDQQLTGGQQAGAVLVVIAAVVTLAKPRPA